jgi:predicted nucleotide-binding protein
VGQRVNPGRPELSPANALRSRAGARSDLGRPVLTTGAVVCAGCAHSAAIGVPDKMASAMAVSPVGELQNAAVELASWWTEGQEPAIEHPLAKLEQAAVDFARAWSGSALGYHSRVYYADFRPPPAGAHFSPEWGFHGRLQGTAGEWREYSYADVEAEIRARAGDPDLSDARRLSGAAREAFANAKADIVSILTAAVNERRDDFIERLLGQAEKTLALTERQAIIAQMPTGTFMSRDSLAVTQGRQAAPHQEIIAEVVAIRSPFTACWDLGKVASRAAAHLNRMTRHQSATGAEGTGDVFIGHGQSLLWRELKDFVSDRLGLPWDEFNRVPVAGVTNIQRLTQLLDNAGIALLILTAEDEQADGSVVARQNVIHEAGLFQGRLGFTRAIVLLEDGCEEFSNINGLGQIRFPAGKINGAFEEVRRVLEREGFLGV